MTNQNPMQTRQRVEVLPPESFLLDAARLNYHDHGGMMAMYQKLAFRVPMILVGPKGVGKSLSLFAFAAKTQIPLVTFSCSEDARAASLLGMLTLRGDETPFVCGPMTTAIDVANKTGKAILLLEEINALTPQNQKLLNGITDFRKRVEVPAAGRVFELDPQAKLWVVGTMNFSVYGGVNALNEDLKSRFSMLPLGYPSSDDERALVVSELKHAAVNLPGDIVDKVLRLAMETRQSDFTYALSPRDVVNMLTTLAATDVATAVWFCMGKFEDHDIALAQARIASIFGNAALALYSRQITVKQQQPKK